MPTCNSCGEYFEDFSELATHILQVKHKAGKKWAANYKLKHVMFDEAMPEHSPLTAEQRQNKIDSRRELSGDMQYANTICPKCKKGGRPLLPVEIVESKSAWRNGNNLVILCRNCGGVA